MYHFVAAMGIPPGIKIQKIGEQNAPHNFLPPKWA